MLSSVRDVLLESRIRGISGVSTCTAGPESVAVVAARGVDAADLERRVLAAVDLEGRSLDVMGGVLMASGRSAGSGGAAAELGRVALVVGAAAGLVGLLVGPSSAHLLQSVLPPVSPLASTTAVVDGEGRPVRAVAHRSSGREASLIASVTGPVASSPALLAAEPAVRRRPTPRPIAPASASASALTLATARPATVVVPDVAQEVAAPAVVTVTAVAKTKGKAATRTVSDARTTTTMAMFSLASFEVDDTKKGRKPERKAESKAVKPAKSDKAEKADRPDKADKADKPKGASAKG
jgi:hypothetical protein